MRALSASTVLGLYRMNASRSLKGPQHPTSSSPLNLRRVSMLPMHVAERGSQLLPHRQATVGEVSYRCNKIVAAQALNVPETEPVAGLHHHIGNAP